MQPILQGLFVSPNLGEHWNSRNETHTHHQGRAGNADRRKKSLRTYRHPRFLCRLPAYRSPQAFWYLGVADLIRIKINQRNADSMLEFHLAKIVQLRSPPCVLDEIVGDAL